MTRVSGHERNIGVQMGPLFGVDLRPTRVFVWLGHGRFERVIPLGGTPRPLRRPRPSRGATLGPVRVWTLGNPVLTLGQTAITAIRLRRHARRARQLSRSTAGAIAPAWRRLSPSWSRPIEPTEAPGPPGAAGPGA